MTRGSFWRFRDFLTRDGAIVPRDFPIPEHLPLLRALSGDEHEVARLRECACLRDCCAAIEDDETIAVARFLGNAREEPVRNLFGVLTVRIVVRHNDDVGTRIEHRAHRRTPVRVALAAGAKDGDNATAHPLSL